MPFKSPETNTEGRGEELFFWPMQVSGVINGGKSNRDVYMVVVVRVANLKV